MLTLLSCITCSAIALILNPDEYLNCDLKIELAKKPERRAKGQWVKTVERTLQNLAEQPNRIKSYFQAKKIQYAAA